MNEEASGNATSQPSELHQALRPQQSGYCVLSQSSGVFIFFNIVIDNSSTVQSLMISTFIEKYVLSGHDTAGRLVKTVPCNHSGQ